MSAPRLRIGIDATFRLFGGSRTHLGALLAVWRERVDHDFVVFTAPQNVDLLRRYENACIRLAVQTPIASRLGRLAWFHTRFPSVVRAAQPDVMLYPGGYLPLGGTPASVVIFRNAAPFCELLTRRAVGTTAWAGFTLLGALMRHSARHARRLIFPSRYLQQIFVRRFQIPAASSVVIYHGRDLHTPHDRQGEDADGRAAVLETLGIRAPYCLYVSHLYRYKNVGQLLDAFHLARDTMRARGLSLVVAGGAPDAEYRAELEARVRTHGLERDVTFTGSLAATQVAQAIAGCESFVFPSACENCPNTLIEALALGKPVAASNVSAMPEICGDAALYFDPTDPGSIATRLVELAGDPELRRTLGARAAARGREFPSWAEVARRTLDEVERVVGGRAVDTVGQAASPR